MAPVLTQECGTMRGAQIPKGGETNNVLLRYNRACA